MKFRTFFNIYKNLIIVLWCVGVIIAFKIINNFEFQNGSSLIFIGLLVVVPFIIYILGIFRKRRLIKQKVAKEGRFIGSIKKDAESKKLRKELLNEFDFVQIENQECIQFENDIFLLEFNNKLAKLTIKDTLIEYKYFYVNKFFEYNKYDHRYVQYYPTTRLYSLIKLQIEELIGHTYIYKENKRGIKLIDQDTNEVVYSLPNIKFQKYRSNVKFIVKM